MITLQLADGEIAVEHESGWNVYFDQVDNKYRFVTDYDPDENYIDTDPIVAWSSCEDAIYRINNCRSFDGWAAMPVMEFRWFRHE